MLENTLVKMNMTILFVIVDTQNMLAVQEFTLPAFMRSPYFFDSSSFLAHINHVNNAAPKPGAEQKTAKVSSLILYGLRFSNLLILCILYYYTSLLNFVKRKIKRQPQGLAGFILYSRQAFCGFQSGIGAYAEAYFYALDWALLCFSSKA